MRPADKQPQPLGIACLFMSLAILPFSLRAVGVDFGVTLSAATDAFRQISGVIGRGYDSAPESLWATAQPVSGSTAEPAEHCPLSIASLDSDCQGEDFSEVVP